MTEHLAAYAMAIGAMLFAALSAFTLISTVKHLDPPERVDAPEERIADKIAV